MGAGLACLIAVSAMLGFRDWPGTDAGRPDGSLTLRAPDRKAAGRVAPGPVAAADLVAAIGPATAAAAALERGDAPRRTDRARGRSRSRPTAPQTPASGGAPVPDAPQSAPAAPDAPSTPSPGSGGGGGSGGSDGGGSGGGGGGGGGGSEPASGPVKKLVGAGRQAVDQVTAPLPVPPAVREPVDQVLDTAEETAGTVDEVVGSVPVAGDTVDGVTGALLP